jgi:hypothetical protein
VQRQHLGALRGELVAAATSSGFVTSSRIGSTPGSVTVEGSRAPA